MAGFILPTLIIIKTIIRCKKQNIDTSVICNKIDEPVYQLYGLTDTEIKIIEQSI